MSFIWLMKDNSEHEALVFVLHAAYEKQFGVRDPGAMDKPQVMTSTFSTGARSKVPGCPGPFGQTAIQGRPVYKKHAEYAG